MQIHLPVIRNENAKAKPEPYAFSYSRLDPLFHFWRIAVFEAARRIGAKLIIEKRSSNHLLVILKFDKDVPQSLILDIIQEII